MAEMNTGTNPKKRDAQSPLIGDADDLKRRIVGEDAPVLITLDELSDSENPADLGSELSEILKGEGTSETDPDKSLGSKVDSLINRMDRFMDCFATLHSTVTKNQLSNDRKFKHLESAHNDLATKVSHSTASAKCRLETLESQLKDSISANSVLANKVANLEEKQSREANHLYRVSDQQAKSINKLGIEQGYITRSLHDHSAEIKERKMIISGVPEFPGESVSVVALGCINKIIDSAIAQKHQDAHLGGLRKLQYDSIDNVFRIGKASGRRKRNISLTFTKYDDKTMVYRAKMEAKDDEGIKFFINDDVSSDGRALKSCLKRVVSAAKEQGKDAKLSGNKVIVESRSYSSNELELLPSDITDSLKQEKIIDDGIVYRGERSILSNFFPAPFTYEGVDYIHVEQFFQHTKAIHHNEILLADRIMNLTKPLRIKLLGDSIESNSSWIERRMMVLYDGVKAKFDQNWPLQEQLLLTRGKHLYEATTDTYFGCGIGFDSKSWSKKDWIGENVSGLIVKKVRDEFLGIDQEEMGADDTLTEIASQEDICSSNEMDMLTSTSENNKEVAPDNSAPQRSTQTSDSSTERSGTGMSYDDLSMYANSSPTYYRGQKGRGRWRGKGRGRGRGAKIYYPKENQKQKYNRDSMSAADRNFLGIKNQRKDRHTSKDAPGINTSSPKQMSWDALTEEQKNGLIKLGIAPSLSAK